MNRRYKDWVEYYQVKGLRGGDIKEVSGYEHGLAQLTKRGLASIINIARVTLNLNSTDILLDLGCGAGLLTVYLIDQVDIIVGVDASMEMLNNADKDSRLIKVQAMADCLPFPDNSFDKIFCHSIFQYFPDYQYAAKAIAEILRVLRPGGKCLIMDIPDLDKKKEYIKVKKSDTHNLERTYYTKKWLTDLIPSADIFERRILDYKNSHFRFNLLMQK